jgi:hypothetical protein
MVVLLQWAFFEWPGGWDLHVSPASTVAPVV